MVEETRRNPNPLDADRAFHVRLAEASGKPPKPGRELGLFRFVTSQAELVKFASELKAELETQGAR